MNVFRGYHFNPMTGRTGPCRAEFRCAFAKDGVIPPHFETAEDAHLAYQTSMRDLELMNHWGAKGKALDLRSCDLAEEIKLLTDELRKTRSKEVADRLEAVRDEYHAAIAELRKYGYYFQIYKKRAIESGVFEDNGVNFITHLATKSNKSYFKTLRRKLTFDKATSSSSMYRVLINEFVAWAGVDREEGKALLRGGKDSHLTKDEYIVSLFQKYAATSKKPMVFVDLETTGFHPSVAEIIEIGMVHVDHEGNVIDRYEERFDLEDPRVRDELGVGPTEVHKIEPADLVGKRVFTDPEVQKEIAARLNDPGVIFSAHNANFEKAFLNHFLKGFREVRDQENTGDLLTGTVKSTIIDTRNVAMFLDHSSKNTSLSSFSENNGVPYVDAHSALPDAEMSMKAFFNFRRRLLSSPEGKRPEATPS